MDSLIVETIMLNEERYLGVAWKNGSVHSMCIATEEGIAHKVVSDSIKLKPCVADVYLNIERMIKGLKLAPSVQ